VAVVVVVVVRGGWGQGSSRVSKETSVTRGKQKGGNLIHHMIYFVYKDEGTTNKGV